MSKQNTDSGVPPAEVMGTRLPSKVQWAFPCRVASLADNLEAPIWPPMSTKLSDAEHLNDVFFKPSKMGLGVLRFQLI